MTFWSVWAKILCHCVYLIALYFSTNSSQIRPETIGDFSIFLWLVVCAVHPQLSIMDVQGLQDTFTSGLMSWGALAHRWRLQASQFWESLTQRTLAIPWLVQGCTALAGLLVRKFELRYVCSVISVLLLCARCQASLWEHRGRFVMDQPTQLKWLSSSSSSSPWESQYGRPMLTYNEMCSQYHQSWVEAGNPVFRGLEWGMTNTTWY